ncbi:MAG TPA: DNA polymerase III subunit beta [Firmicutes bacterium]|nr:DNA polymerase III subunit beta [Bacillota bacterium]
MKLIFKKEELSKILGVIEKALPVRSPVPIVNNIYFHCQEEEVFFSATNLELEIRYTLPYESKHNFKLLLPPKLVEVIRYLPAQDVEISYDLERYRIDIACGPANYHLYGADPAEYPLTEHVTVEHSYTTINQAQLKQALRQVVFASSNEEGRPVFTGLLFSFEQQGITITASDTYRLAISSLTAPSSSDPQQLLIPARSIQELIKVLNDDDQPVTIGFQENQVVFKFEGITFITKVLDERFPDISGIIPTNYRTRVKLPRQTLEETVTRASLLSEGVNKAICLSLEGSNLKVKGSSEIGEMEESFTVQSEGEEFEIYVNSRFLMDMIKSVDCEQLSTEINGKNGPIIFRPVEDVHYLYLVLPIKMD